MEAYILEIVVVLASLVGTVMGVWMRSVEKRIKDACERIQSMITKEEAEHLIDLKQGVLRSEQAAMRKDLLVVEAKLDRIIDLLLNPPGSRQ